MPAAATASPVVGPGRRAHPSVGRRGLDGERRGGSLRRRCGCRGRGGGGVHDHGLVAGELDRDGSHLAPRPRPPPGSFRPAAAPRPARRRAGRPCTNPCPVPLARRHQEAEARPQRDPARGPPRTRAGRPARRARGRAGRRGRARGPAPWRRGRLPRDRAWTRRRRAGGASASTRASGASMAGRDLEVGQDVPVAGPRRRGSPRTGPPPRRPRGRPRGRGTAGGRWRRGGAGDVARRRARAVGRACRCGSGR